MSYSLNAEEERTLESTVVQEYTYVYNGGTLMQMVIETTVDDGEPVTETLSFTYDAGGTPMTISHNGTVYYYVTNLQGDVVAIVDSTGVQVVGYTYDAWGKVLSQTGTMAWSLGEENPLRYRGYVYDPETGLYYVSSRYYDPEIGRFINADAVDMLGANGDFASLNLFAYCGNNPVLRADSNGRFWHLVVGGVIGGIIGGISSAVSGGDFVDILIGVTAGAAGGILAASGAGIIVQALGGAAISMASNAASQMNHIVQDETGEMEFDVGDMLIDGAVGLTCGIWGGNGASYGNSGGIKAAGKQLLKRGFFNPQARSYYAKVAHNMGGEYVFKPLLKSLGKSAVGSAVVTGKNLLTK